MITASHKREKKVSSYNRCEFFSFVFFKIYKGSCTNLKRYTNENKIQERFFNDLMNFLG